MAATRRFRTTARSRYVSSTSARSPCHVCVRSPRITNGPQTGAFRRACRWCAGIESRISVLKADVESPDAATNGEAGRECRVDWGLLAHNLRQFSRDPNGRMTAQLKPFAHHDQPAPQSIRQKPACGPSFAPETASCQVERPVRNFPPAHSVRMACSGRPSTQPWGRVCCGIGARDDNQRHSPPLGPLSQRAHQC
jgi:hypothetical protein